MTKGIKIKNKAWRLISMSILVLSLLLLSYSVLMKAINRVPRIFGYSFHIVVTASMEPDIMTYDFIVAKKIDTNEIAVGDYLVFKSSDPLLQGKVIVHRVEGVSEKSGVRHFTTKGIANHAADQYTTPESNVIGIYAGKSTILSAIVRTAVKAINFLLFHFQIFFIIVMLTLILIIAYLIFRIRKLYKY